MTDGQLVKSSGQYHVLDEAGEELGVELSKYLALDLMNEREVMALTEQVDAIDRRYAERRY